MRTLGSEAPTPTVPVHGRQGVGGVLGALVACGHRDHDAPRDGPGDGLARAPPVSPPREMKMTRAPSATAALIASSMLEDLHSLSYASESVGVA